jgi:hypothetical protein
MVHCADDVHCTGTLTHYSNDAREWRYYTIAVVEPGADLSLALTPLSGDQDPDMYVSAPHLPLPTLTNHTWASVRFGADALLLQVCVMVALL